MRARPEAQLLMDARQLASLEAWLGAIVGARPPVAAVLFAGGRSNLTYALTDAAGDRWVLRCPPEGLKVGRAHDVLREHRVMNALAEADGVAVPRTYGADAGDVLGVPCFVMEHVDGVVLRGRKQSSLLSEPVRARASTALVDAFAAIHAADLARTGLADLAPHTGYLERQLDRWYASFEATRTRSIPAVDDLHSWLARNLPETSEATLVHGDFRLDNAVFDDAGRLRAILDWELATIGDPLADLALTVAYWAGEGEEAVGPAALPGFPDRRQLIDRYADVSGRSVDTLHWYLVLAYWKLACIAEQVAARYARGGGGGDRSAADDLGCHTIRFAARACEIRDDPGRF